MMRSVALVDEPGRTGKTQDPRGVAAVWRTPGAAQLIVASLVAAIPSGAIGVLLILHVRHLGGSYALAGLAAGGYAVGAAMTGPLAGRLVDRHRVVPVLLGCVAMTGAALVALAFLTEGSPRWLIVVLAICGGLTHPPVGAITRTLLPVVIENEETLHGAYALESSALEISYIVGPALIGGLIATQSTSAALLVDAGVLVLGNAWFMSLPVPRSWRPESIAAGPRSKLGALTSPAVRLLLLIITAFSISFGAVEVAVTAAASGLDHRSLSGPLLASWGLGSLIGGVILAGRGAPEAPHRRLLLLLAALAAGDALLVATAGNWAFAALLPLSGLAIAPAYAVVNAMTGLSAASGTSTEAFAWLGTGVSAGFSGGAIFAGAAADLGGASGAFGVSLIAVVVAMAVLVAGRALLIPLADVSPAVTTG